MLAHCCRVPWHGWKSVAPRRKARRQASGCGDAGSSGGAGSSGSRQRRRRDGSVSGAVPNAEKHRVSARGDCIDAACSTVLPGLGQGRRCTATNSTAGPVSCRCPCKVGAGPPAPPPIPNPHPFTPSKFQTAVFGETRSSGDSTTRRSLRRPAAPPAPPTSPHPTRTTWTAMVRRRGGRLLPAVCCQCGRQRGMACNAEAGRVLQQQSLQRSRSSSSSSSSSSSACSFRRMCGVQGAASRCLARVAAAVERAAMPATACRRLAGLSVPPRVPHTCSLGVLRGQGAVWGAPQGVLAEAPGAPLWHSTRQGGAGCGMDHRHPDAGGGDWSSSRGE
jgi:hypothetical protein